MFLGECEPLYKYVYMYMYHHCHRCTCETQMLTILVRQAAIKELPKDGMGSFSHGRRPTKKVLAKDVDQLRKASVVKK